jgi:hypothetical protein
MGGCVALSGGGGGYVAILNTTDIIEAVPITIVDTDSQETVLEETFRVKADAEREIIFN